MSRELPITFACGPYDRMEALRCGDVKIEGVAITYRAIQPAPKIFREMIERRAFDVAEMSLSTHFIERSQGRYPFVAIPVFPSRVFRHGYIFITRNSRIAEPSDLNGKRIGLEGYKQTASVWIRGLLSEEYGVDLSGVRWLQGPLEKDDVVHPIEALQGVRIDPLPVGNSLSEMLVAGEIDAIIGPRTPSALAAGAVTRLFRNYRATEEDYFRRTGIFPIMHTLVIREELHEEQPWLARALLEACVKSKSLALDRMRFSGAMRYMLPWLYDDIEEIDRLFGGDPWPYGVEPNQPALDTLARYLLAQKLVPAPVACDQMFVAT
jgi:4,5-dihydroxyphthalate decarboxylase